jgi:hypothetical protein
MGSGEIFLTEGGSETEILYRHGFELPEFAMFPLLDDPRAAVAMRAMFCAQLDVAAEFGLSFLLSGLDYRASPDWGAKLGYSPAALAEANLAAIGFLREIAEGYHEQIPRLLIGGILGPRGDAYPVIHCAGGISSRAVDRLADLAAFCSRSVFRVDLTGRIWRKAIVSVATQHPSWKRAFAGLSPGQIHTGHLPQSHDPTAMRKTLGTGIGRSPTREHKDDSYVDHAGTTVASPPDASA